MIRGDDPGKSSSKSHERRALAIFIVVVIVIATLIFVDFWSHRFHSPYSEGDLLMIAIEAPSESYQIMLPIPVEWNRTPWYLLRSLALTRGNATFSLTNTTKGQMLSVESNESVTLTAKAPPRGEEFFTVRPQNLSGWLQREGSIPYFVWLNASGRETEIGLSFLAISWDGSHDYITDIVAPKGWLGKGWQGIWGGAGYAGV